MICQGVGRDILPQANAGFCSGAGCHAHIARQGGHAVSVSSTVPRCVARGGPGDKGIA